MSDAESAVAARAPSQPRVAELKVSGHLMNLEPGLFCIVQAPARGDLRSGLPGVRVSLPPGAPAHSENVSIRAFRDDGWLGAGGDAALVRVSGQPAQILVTVYQAQGAAETAPSLQVLKLIDPSGQPVGAGAPDVPVPAIEAPSRRAPEVMDLLAHIQGRGDTGGKLDQWLGVVGSKAWIEGFAIAPTRDVAPDDIEYQAVLGRGWLSPWVDGGQFCGSRGMGLPVLGLRVRLRGKGAEEFECLTSASFVDGTQIGPVPDGEACEAESLAAVEAIKVTLRRRDGTAGTEATASPEKSAAARSARPKPR
jgi:hypothetical protein